MKPILHEHIKVDKPTISDKCFSFIDDLELRFQLYENIQRAKTNRKKGETQKEVSQILNISLTKIKEIENGTCKDFNSINNNHLWS